MIDELSKLHTTAQVVSIYCRNYGKDYLYYLQEDMRNCSKGNRLAIEACLGREWKMYTRNQIERPLDENKDIIAEMRGE